MALLRAHGAASTVLLTALLHGCQAADEGQAASPAPAGVSAVATSDAMPTDATPTDATPTHDGGAAPAALAEALPALTPIGPMQLSAVSAEGRSLRVTLAARGSQTGAYDAQLRALAFARLAEKLACPVASVRRERPRLAELLAALTTRPAWLGDVQVANDGRLTLLLETRPAEGELIAPGDAAVRYRSGAEDEVPTSPGERRLAADYVCMRALDYLTAHLWRQRVMIADGRIWLVDNDRAFRPYIAAGALDTLLEPLASVRRFPADFVAALERTRLEQIADILTYADHQDRIWGPRQRADFAERRATLLSFIGALRDKYGEEEALSL